MNRKMRKQTSMNRYEYLKILLLQFEDPGFTVGTDL